MQTAVYWKVYYRYVYRKDRVLVYTTTYTIILFILGKYEFIVFVNLFPTDYCY